MYTDKSGNEHRSYIISEERFLRMEKNGYHYEIANCHECEQELYDRLSSKYETVRIYESTTRVKGCHDIYAMVKDRIYK